MLCEPKQRRVAVAGRHLSEGMCFSQLMGRNAVPDFGISAIRLQNININPVLCIYKSRMPKYRNPALSSYDWFGVFPCVALCPGRRGRQSRRINAQQL